MFLRSLIVICFLCVGACADAQPATAANPPAASASADESGALMDKLVGRWILTGTIAGQATVHDVEAEWTLQHKYVRITETSREAGDNGAPAYEATIYVGWLESEHRYVCIWLDNTEVASGAITCSAHAARDAIPFEFRDAQGALSFTNTFAYNRGADTWEWRMDNINNGVAQTFGAVTLRRP